MIRIIYQYNNDDTNNNDNNNNNENMTIMTIIIINNNDNDDGDDDSDNIDNDNDVDDVSNDDDDDDDDDDADSNDNNNNNNINDHYHDNDNDNNDDNPYAGIKHKDVCSHMIKNIISESLERSHFRLFHTAIISACGLTNNKENIKCQHLRLFVRGIDTMTSSCHTAIILETPGQACPYNWCPYMHDFNSWSR